LASPTPVILFRTVLFTLAKSPSSGLKTNPMPAGAKHALAKSTHSAIRFGLT